MLNRAARLSKTLVISLSYGKAEHDLANATYDGTNLKLALGNKLDVEGFYNETSMINALGDNNTIKQATVGNDEDALKTIPLYTASGYSITNIPVTNITGQGATVRGFIDFHMFAHGTNSNSPLVMDKSVAGNY